MDEVVLVFDHVVDDDTYGLHLVVFQGIVNGRSVEIFLVLGRALLDLVFVEKWKVL